MASPFPFLTRVFVPPTAAMRVLPRSVFPSSPVGPFHPLPPYEARRPCLPLLPFLPSLATLPLLPHSRRLLRAASSSSSSSSSSSPSSSSPSSSPSSRARIVFLGTPEVAAGALDLLFHAAGQSDAPFEVAAVVTQPARAKGRGKKITPTPVHELAVARGLDVERIWVRTSLSSYSYSYSSYDEKYSHRRRHPSVRSAPHPP